MECFTEVELVKCKLIIWLRLFGDNYIVYPLGKNNFQILLEHIRYQDILFGVVIEINSFSLFCFSLVLIYIIVSKAFSIY